ncbi:TRAP transporter large permease (plasmid) [Paracoccus sp. TD-10]|uniref:TRAP transporter large permease n=1 Tax=Paracoccus sp. TD-10 TaxID=3395918 RepID=UPI003AADA460
MSGILIAAIAVLFVALLIRVPVFIALLAGTAVYFFGAGQANPLLLIQRFTSGMESIPLLAVPFFVCAGVFMNYAGITDRIMVFCAALTASIWGGLAQVNILLSTLMGGMSGSSLADAAMTAKMLVPQMERRGMSKAYSTVVTAFSSTITPLIPPGIGMIIYGSTANVSIGQLFMGGISVGLLTCVTMMMLTAWIARRRGYAPLKTTAEYEPVPLGRAFMHALLPLFMPVVVLGGIRAGIFTPTEAGAVAVVYALALGLYYRELSGAKLSQCLKETVLTTAVIMLIVGAASALAWVLTRERVPQALTEWMVEAVANKYVFLIIVNIFLLVVGMFIEGNAAMIVLVPLLVPIARAFGIDDIHFAFVFIFNLAIGAITPPMGTLMFVTCGITGCRIREFLAESVPYFAQLLFVLLLITFVPQVSTLLVDILHP